MKELKIIFVTLFIIGLSLVIYSQFISPSSLVLSDKSKTWVYLELKVDLVRDTTDYFYFGQINESVLDEIDKPNYRNRLFKLSSIRYWNNDDLLEIHEDEKTMDYRIFHLDDIRMLKGLKKDPIFIYDENELTPEALEIRKNSETQ